MPWSLIPFRNGKPLGENIRIELKENCPIGRRELLHGIWDACSCSCNCNCSTTKCRACQLFQNPSFYKVIPRQLLRIRNDDQLQVKGENAAHLVQINGHAVFLRYATKSTNNINNNNNEEWTSRSVTLQNGMILTVQRRDHPDAVLEYKVKSERINEQEQPTGTEQVKRNGASSVVQEATKCNNENDSDAPLVPVDCITTSAPKVDDDARRDANDTAPNHYEEQPPQSPVVDDDDADDEADTPSGTQDLMERVRLWIEADSTLPQWTNDKDTAISNDGDDARDVASAEKMNDERSRNDAKPPASNVLVEKETPMAARTLQENIGDNNGPSAPIVAEATGTTAHAPIQLVDSPITDYIHPVQKSTNKGVPPLNETTQPRKLQPKSVVVDLVSVGSVESTSDELLHEQNESFRIMFVRAGQGARVIELRSNVARNKGAVVVQSLDAEPTHLIIGGNPDPGAIASELKYRNASAMATSFWNKNIELVKSDWIVTSGATLRKPTMQQLWKGLAYLEPKEPRKHRLSGADDTSRLKVLRTVSAEKAFAPRNMKLSEMFHALSKLHQSCPLLGQQDLWKAYCYEKVSGRLKHLDFEIVNDPQVLKRLGAIKGIGDGSMEKVRQFLQTGTCDRIQEFKTDPDRVAMGVLMNIWGVGPAMASELFKAGYRTMDQVRKDVATGTLVLTRNQLIGVECYEEFLERMPRSEVEAIADIVIKAAKERFPNAEIIIMGSYRRGQMDCGDIDLLITDSGFDKTTPRGALGELCDRLMRRGHMAYHLTHLEGMTREAESSQSSSASHQTLPPPPPAKQAYPTSQTYMGVFYSPFAGKKRRRIDIKFYPYRERAFASLYFTGNGWFNRSMRLWAKTAKSKSLNDHGLFPVVQLKNHTHVPKPSERLDFEASTEKQVFDELGLVYKEPTERLCFDDVIPIGEQSNPMEMTRQQAVLSGDDEHHTWID